MLSVNTVSDFIGKVVQWRGTAGELAETVQEILQALGLDTEPTPTERLVRYYVTEGVLSRPDREGREARFGFRQIIEFLAVRILLADGWSLARIADYFRTVSIEGLLSLLPPVPGIAQAKYEMAPSAPLPRPAPTAAEMLVGQFAERYETKRPATSVPPATIAPPDAVRARAQAKQEIKVALARLGVVADIPPRAGEVRFTLAPWCEVHILPEALEESLRRATLNPEREQIVEDIVRVFRAAIEEEITRRGRR